MDHDWAFYRYQIPGFGPVVQYPHEHLPCSSRLVEVLVRILREELTPEIVTRFWDKVKLHKVTGCWVWTAAVRTWKREPWDGGYGAFWLPPDGVVRAHRFAYELLYGEVPKGKLLLHQCDNRRCVNVVSHIILGTQKQNVADMIKKGRRWGGNGKQAPQTPGIGQEKVHP